MVILAAVNSLSMSLKTFDWLRLVETTAFYINLIGQTITDIRSFTILLFSSFLLFGLPMMMLDFWTDPGKRLFSDQTNNLFANMVLNQYMTALGEFHTDAYL